MSNYWLDLDKVETEHPVLFWDGNALKTHLAHHMSKPSSFLWEYDQKLVIPNALRCGHLRNTIDTCFSKFTLQPDHEGYFMITSVKVTAFLSHYSISHSLTPAKSDKALNDFVGTIFSQKLNSKIRLYSSVPFSMYNHVLLGTYTQQYQHGVHCGGLINW